jgi:N-acetylglutamate synthase-like GNAT family acetyltransferase
MSEEIQIYNNLEGIIKSFSNKELKYISRIIKDSISYTNSKKTYKKEIIDDLIATICDLDKIKKETDHRFNIVYKINDKIIGIGCLRKVKYKGEYRLVSGLYVHPKYRNRGIAKEILKQMKEKAKDFGVKAIYAHTLLFPKKANWYRSKKISREGIKTYNIGPDNRSEFKVYLIKKSLM